MKIKKILGKVHLWIGLIIGILIFIISISGALYTWAPEISYVIYNQKVEPQDSPFVSVSVLKSTIDQQFPDSDFRTVFYKDKSSTAEVLLYAPGTYYKAFLNPYSGKLVHLQDMKKGWLNYLVAIHRNLMLGDIGRQIVHWTTLLFLLMVITGIVLWWPKDKHNRKQRLSINWRVSPKKLNYDWHNIIGFYSSWIIIFSIVTGLFWGFEIVRNTLMKVTGEVQMVYEQPISENLNSSNDSNKFVIMDSLAQVFLNKYPRDFIRISNPHKNSDPIHVIVHKSNITEYDNNHYYFDRYNGEQIIGHFENGLYKDASLYHTLHGMVYSIHFGNILGFPGRLLMFFASLVVASLPITGFVIWLGKRNKSRS